MTKYGFLMVLVLALGGCQNPEDKTTESPDLIKVVCTVPDGTLRGRLEVHYTSKKYPLYRGGWDFTNTKGQKVLSTLCHSVH